VQIQENRDHSFWCRNRLFQPDGQFLIHSKPRARSLSIPKNPRFVTSPKQIPIPPPRRDKFGSQRFCTINACDFLIV
jgi:hypothetical protein